MKWISFILTVNAVFRSVLFSAVVSIFSCTFGCNLAAADPPPSYRQQHPLASMHALPVGELPGWSEPWWFNFEAGAGNVWSAPLIMTDKRNGKEYKYMADFEQNNYILELGAALSQSFSAAIEVPIVDRGGGALDGFIDSFHVVLDNRRFNRQYYPKYQDIYSVKTDDVDYYSEDELGDGIANLKLKLKYWFYKKVGKQKNSCPCGLAISSQTKFPTQPAKYGGTTGEIDQTVLLHLGVPLFSSSGMWFTAGNTFLGDYDAMKEWPRFKQIQMYELNFDFSIDSNWGVIMSARAESPFLNVKHLAYYDLSDNPKVISTNRAASGWNSLVRWRGAQSLGLRYRTMAGNQLQFLIAEDFGIGPYDASDSIYSNNAPDVNFVFQASW